MGLLGSLASLLGVETGAIIDRAKESAVAIAAIGLFVLIAVSFLLVALYNWLTAWLGPIWSPLIIAAAAVVIALILSIALRIQTAALKRRVAAQRQQAESTALMASAALAALPDLLESPLVRAVGLPIGLYLGFLLLTRRKNKDSDVDGGLPPEAI